MGKITGTIIRIDETMTVGSKGFQKREFVIETDEPKYPQKLKISLLGQDYCNLIDKYRTGQKVALEYTLKGSEWNGKYFVEVSCWKIDPIDRTGTTEPPKAEPKKTTSQQAKEENIDYDDLPF
jgi:single-strand DNA-binding protein